MNSYTNEPKIAKNNFGEKTEVKDQHTSRPTTKLH